MISVIIPVYNVEKYIAKCLQSVIDQTYADLQIIVVDDGSTDDSEKVYLQFAKNDRRIKIIKKQNGGVSSARNIGLENAAGEYVYFLDGDDYIDNNYLGFLYEKSKSNATDIQIGAYVKEDEQGNIIGEKKNNPDKIFAFDDSYDSFAYYAHRGVTCCLIKKEIIDRYNVRFDSSIKIGEDLLFYSRVLVNASLVGYSVNTPLYHYVIHGDSAFHKGNLQSMYTNITAHRKVVEIFENKDCKNAAKNAKKYLVFKCNDLYDEIKKRGKTERKPVKASLKKDIRNLKGFVMRSDMGIKFKIKWLIMCL